MSDGRHHLIYNGELYNYKQIRSQLETLGETFASNSDTEVFLKALKHFGVDGLHLLKGMFAFIYYDEAQNTVFAGRDRFGIKPLLLTQSGNIILLASEAKQLLQSGLASRRVNLDTLSSYLVHGALQLDENTFFKDIKTIQPGELIQINCGSREVTRRKWYSLKPRHETLNVTYEDARQNIKQLFRNSVKQHLVSDVPLCASLSGGIDSSAIVCVASELRSHQPITTITTFSNFTGFDERRFSRLVSTDMGCKPIEIEVDEREIWDSTRLQELAYYQDQPTISGSQLNEYHVFKAAKNNGFTVLLDGQGADEYFGGYSEFWYAGQMDNLRAGRFDEFRLGLLSESEGRNLPMKNIMALFLRRFFQSQISRAMPITPKWYRLPISPMSIQLPDRFDGLSLSHMTSTSLPFQLHSQDRNSMRWSVESRVPFLDHELVEYVWSLPAHFKFRSGQRKRILRDAIDELPTAVAERRDKVGFAAPDHIGLLNNTSKVRSELSDALDELKTLLNGRLILNLFDQMIHNHSPYNALFFRILSLSAWRRAFSTDL